MLIFYIVSAVVILSLLAFTVYKIGWIGLAVITAMIGFFFLENKKLNVA